MATRLEEAKAKLLEIKSAIGPKSFGECESHILLRSMDYYLYDVAWLIRQVEEYQDAIMKIQLCSMYILESKNGRKIKDICDEVLLEWTASE